LIVEGGIGSSVVASLFAVLGGVEIIGAEVTRAYAELILRSGQGVISSTAIADVWVQAANSLPSRDRFVRGMTSDLQ